MRFPTCNVHWYCVPCCAEILQLDYGRFEVDPVPFGCPACPNGCRNPARGYQCNCEEYDSTIRSWMKLHPAQSDAWQDAEDVSMSVAFPVSQQCPLCVTQVPAPT